uniref:Uncharacterized protein n=1 Tax=Tetradesmus obliquus TaxID=3088 RepID=A0A383VBX0_TETOB|eukprot:jgi/Sobl393_1/9597/SZX62681.1
MVSTRPQAAAAAPGTGPAATLASSQLPPLSAGTPSHQQQQQPPRGATLTQVLQDGPPPAATAPEAPAATPPLLAADAPAAAAAATPQPAADNSSSGGSTPAALSNVPGAAAATLSVAPGTVSQVAAAGVPDRCIIAGSSLFSSCAVEIATAQKRFNISVDVIAPQNYTALLAAQGVSRDAAIAYMRQVLARPSASCCSAHCRFQQQLLCDCEPTVLDVAVRFAGADNAFYGLLVRQLAAGCGHKLFFNETCPANRTAALISSATASLGLMNGTAGVAGSDVEPVVLDGRCILVNGTTAADSSTALPTASGGGSSSRSGGSSNNMLVPAGGDGDGGAPSGSGSGPGR